MATVFSNFSKNAPHAVVLARRLMKKLPEDFTIWFSMEADHPDCFVLWRERFGFLVQIALTGQELAETALQGSLFAGEVLTVDELGEGERTVLDRFARELGDGVSGAMPVRKVVIFPNVDDGTIDEISLMKSEETEVRFLGMRRLGASAFATALETLATEALPEPALVRLRRRFSPEIVVPESFSPLAISVRNTSAQLRAGLLDIDQEWCVKNHLQLSEDAEDALVDREAESGRAQLVTGVAGSGKSLVLLYRAMLYARLEPCAQILVLTHNRPLNHELERRFGILDEEAHNVEWLTFFSWASRCLESWEEETINPWQTEMMIETLLHEARAEGGKAPRFSATFLVDEIGWIKDHGLLDRSKYLQIERVGRGMALGKTQRNEVWEIYRTYQKRLKAENKTDWHNVAMRFCEGVATEKFGFPKYDCILVDEAQFFAKSWFDVVKAALNPGAQLFLAADPTQGFLRRRQSWLASGIEVRGRTTQLKQAYRNSRQVLEFAAAFYAARGEDGDEAEGLNVPTAAQLAKIEFEGERPKVVCCGSVQDAHARVANEVAELKRGGLSPGVVLVLHADSPKLKSLIAMLEGKLGAGEAHNAKQKPSGKAAFCQVSTLNAATGLEAQIVFLLGIDAVLDKEGSPQLDEGERGDLCRDNTRQLYMAFTRAGQRLVVVTTNEKRCAWLDALKM